MLKDEVDEKATMTPCYHIVPDREASLPVLAVKDCVEGL